MSPMNPPDKTGAFEPNLGAYFERIGDRGPRDATLATLNRIVEAHVRTIPFENVDVLMGVRISVDPAAVEQKLILGGRGGYCFEQNTYLREVLVALGFQVQAMSARVRFQKPTDVVPSRTHIFLRVELDGVSWLVDVGVGSLSLTSAIRLELDAPQKTPHDTRRIVASGAWTGLEQRAPDAVLFHQVRLGHTWETVADFTLEEMHPIDIELGNWYTSMHPGSHFRTRLNAARSNHDGRLSLQGRAFKSRRRDGTATTTELSSSHEVLDCLREQFGLQLPEGALSAL